MATTYPMPKWGVTMEDGEIVGWNVTPGQEVKEGDVLAEVETDKITVEFEAPADGVVAALLAEAGAVVECGTDLLVLADDAADYEAYVKSKG